MQAPVAQEIRADSTDPAPVLSITTPAAQPAKRRTLTEAVVDAIRVRHYSRKTEQAYVHWIRRFVAWSGKRHPRDMGGAEVAYGESRRILARHPEKHHLVRFVNPA